MKQARSIEMDEVASIQLTEESETQLSEWASREEEKEDIGMGIYNIIIPCIMYHVCKTRNE